ncbi:hypothetical protein Tco_1560985 [Tanacetum coccineum]
MVNVVGKVIGSKDSNLEKSHQTLQPARNPLRLCGICVCIDDRDDCNTSSSTSVPYGVSNLSTISHQQNHQGTHFVLYFLNPSSSAYLCFSTKVICLCQLLSTPVGAMVKKICLTTNAYPPIPRQLTSSRVDPYLENKSQWIQYFNMSYLTFDYHSSTQNRRGHYPTSSEAFESLIKETFANAVRLNIALLRPVSRTAGTGNTAIAMGSCYQFLLKRTTTSCYRDHGEKMEGITGMMAQTMGLERSLLYIVERIEMTKRSKNSQKPTRNGKKTKTRTRVKNQPKIKAGSADTARKAVKGRNKKERTISDKCSKSRAKSDKLSKFEGLFEVLEFQGLNLPNEKSCLLKKRKSKETTRAKAAVLKPTL